MKLLSAIWNFILECLVGEANMPQPEIPVPTTPLADPVPVEPVVDRVGNLEKFAKAQQEFEGWFPNSTSQRHNNPGNIKDRNGNFITFDTYEDGFTYLKNYILRVRNGEHEAYPKGGDTNILEYTHTYTADKEPAPSNYANAIARALKTLPSTKLRDIV